MKIFYTASYYGKEKYQKYYDKILQAINETGVELISPEKGNYKEIIPKPQRKNIKSERKVHYEAIKRGILWADAVIIEISNEDFQLGHEATLAIQNKKPVLCLSLHEDFSEKINNRYFHGAKYNVHNLRPVIQNFIKKYKKGMLSERFNFFISPSQLEYLEKESQNSGISKAELIRTLIDQTAKNTKPSS